MNNFLNMVMQMRNNPQQFLGKIGIPSNIMNDPNAIIQYGLNNNMFTQQQYNQAVAQLEQWKKNPQFMQMFCKK